MAKTAAACRRTLRTSRLRPGRAGNSRAACAPKSKGAGIAASPFLRRDVDLPVFVSLATRRSPAPRSWRTSSGYRFPPRWFRKEPHFPSAPRSEDPFASGPLRVRPKTSRALAFIGPSWAGPLSRGLTSWGSPPSRQPGPTLPAPLTGWSESPLWRFVTSSLRRAVQPRTRGASIACRRRSVFLSSPPPVSPLPAPLEEAGTSVPITIGQ